jgi:putative endonuclease
MTMRRDAQTPEARRRAAEGRGRRAEALAVLWLRLKGYRVLARRARTPVGEIDLILRRGAVVAFVEVKARDRLEDALSALTPGQCRRIERAARWWMAHRTAGTGERGRGREHGLAGCAWRFDLVAIGAGGRPRHLPDAWRPPG